MRVRYIYYNPSDDQFYYSLKVNDKYLILYQNIRVSGCSDLHFVRKGIVLSKCIV